MSIPQTESVSSAPPSPPARLDQEPPSVSGDGHDAIPIAHPARPRPWKLIIGGGLLLVILVGGGIWYLRTRNIVSTDDAYVNGHVTFVAARVNGQVMNVLVEDNNHVRKGQLLAQLDPEPYTVQLKIAEAAVTAAQSDVVVADAQAHAVVGRMRSLRFALQHEIENVQNQIALLHARVATITSQHATLDKAQLEYERGVKLSSTGAIGGSEVELRKEAFLVAQARLEEALQGAYEVRVSLGLTPKPLKGDDLTDVPADIDQTFSSVRQAQSSLIEAAAQVGYTDSFDKTPKQMIADFYKLDPEGNIDRIYANLIKNAPGVKQAHTKLEQAERSRDQAALNVRYCNIYAEIDGVVYRRNVNPGNNVVAGQSLMAVRSLKEIWIDANFKETQLAELRIGQPVDLDVDMYGSRRHFKGRISGFTVGTGSTLALLPAENATGNFVKVVQRLPVRIELLDYDPEIAPLFIGLSVSPHVDLKGELTGPHAGQVLQPYLPTTPSSSTQPSTSPATTPGSAQ